MDSNPPNPSPPIKLRVELKLTQEKQSQQQKFLIYTYEQMGKTCLEITIRSFPQMTYLFMTLTQQYGGFIIPVLNLNSFAPAAPPEAILILFREYLNDLLESPHCRNDHQLKQFILTKQIDYPQIDKFDKVLKDAALLSRKYLNNFFTRKEVVDMKHEYIQLRHAYETVVEFKEKFKQLRELANWWEKEQELIQEMTEMFHEAGGLLGLGVQPIDFASGKFGRSLEKLWKLLLQTDEAYMRWEVLQQTVRQLQCNVYKGLHEDNPTFKKQSLKLQNWSKTLFLDMHEMLKEGEQLLDNFSQHLYVAKKHQMWVNSVSLSFE